MAEINSILRLYGDRQVGFYQFSINLKALYQSLGLAGILVVFFAWLVAVEKSAFSVTVL
ncbi:MAG: hypothetical protein RMX96_14735 [Nostoc sp. ChiSLP02]|nr:hypothetical protein [Nostoc sp. DedSLP05]MDZ8099648.1 hypothetical protein [Nostoc sp. DedSLP01]MDZ8186095.1 hypothetical protein [Nostoc sp. ChiSLP02]